MSLLALNQLTSPSCRVNSSAAEFAVCAGFTDHTRDPVSAEQLRNFTSGVSLSKIPIDILARAPLNPFMENLPKNTHSGTHETFSSIAVGVHHGQEPEDVLHIRSKTSSCKEVSKRDQNQTDCV